MSAVPERPVLFHCALDGWVYHHDPTLTDEQAEYDMKKAADAHVLMALMYDKVPKHEHKFRAGPVPDSTSGPGSPS